MFTCGPTFVGSAPVEAPPSKFQLEVKSGSGTGLYSEGTQVTVTAGPPPLEQGFVGWVGDSQILADPEAPSTTATMPSMNVSIEAFYTFVQ